MTSPLDLLAKAMQELAEAQKQNVSWLGQLARAQALRTDPGFSTILANARQTLLRH